MKRARLKVRQGVVRCMPGRTRALAAVALATIAATSLAYDVDLRAPADPRLAPLATGHAVALSGTAGNSAGAAPPSTAPGGAVGKLPRGPAPGGAPGQPASRLVPPAQTPGPEPAGAAPTKPPQFEAPATL